MAASDHPRFVGARRGGALPKVQTARGRGGIFRKSPRPLIGRLAGPMRRRVTHPVACVWRVCVCVCVYVWRPSVRCLQGKNTRMGLEGAADLSRLRDSP